MSRISEDLIHFPKERGDNYERTAEGWSLDWENCRTIMGLKWCWGQKPKLVVKDFQGLILPLPSLERRNSLF